MILGDRENDEDRVGEEVIRSGLYGWIFCEIKEWNKFVNIL